MSALYVEALYVSICTPMLMRSTILHSTLVISTLSHSTLDNVCTLRSCSLRQYLYTYVIVLYVTFSTLKIITYTLYIHNLYTLVLLPNAYVRIWYVYVVFLLSYTLFFPGSLRCYYVLYVVNSTSLFPTLLPPRLLWPTSVLCSLRCCNLRQKWWLYTYLRNVVYVRFDTLYVGASYVGKNPYWWKSVTSWKNP